MARQKSGNEERKGVSITIRVTPRTKFVIDLLTRQQNRSVTALFEAFIARAEDDAFGYERTTDGPMDPMGTTRASLVDQLWDTDDVSRLVNLASIAPKLMNYEEQVLWRVIRDQPPLWLVTQREFPLRRREGETEQEQEDRLIQSMASSPSPFRYKLVKDPIAEGVKTEYWLDLLLTRKAWPDIQRAAEQEITPDELSSIVAELANTLQAPALKHQAPPPMEDDFG